MKNIFSSKWKHCLGAVLVIGLLVCLIQFWPQHKPSVTLQDGTLIRLEKVSMIGPNLLDRLRIQIGKNADWDAWCQKQGWTMPNRSYWAIVEFFTDNPKRFIPIEEDPLRWLDPTPDSFDRITIGLSHEGDFNTSNSPLKSTGQPGCFQAEIHYGDQRADASIGLNEVTFLLYRRDGKTERAELLISEKGHTVGFNKRLLEKRGLLAPPKLPCMDQSSGGPLTAELVRIPRGQDGQQDVVIRNNGKDVTTDYFISTWAPFSKGLLWFVSCQIYPQNLELILPQNRLIIPSAFLHPNPGEAHAIPTQSLDPNFWAGHVWLVGKGVYVIHEGDCLFSATNLADNRTKLEGWIKEFKPVVKDFPGMRILGDETSNRLVLEVSQPLAFFHREQARVHDNYALFDVWGLCWRSEGSLVTPVKNIMLLDEQVKTLELCISAGTYFSWTVEPDPKDIETAKTREESETFGGIRYGK
ncbi:MAG: hypothetical protein LBV12_11350 [Puniceicoccales bacterium]|jgi:hypothetical protein|nr:hypothetical protein [Puniceicoccales bacterium]